MNSKPYVYHISALYLYQPSVQYSNTDILINVYQFIDIEEFGNFNDFDSFMIQKSWSVAWF
jgi:hypothetical protein